MRNLTCKFVLLCVVLIASCSPCNDLDVADYTDNLSTIEIVKDILIKENLLNQNTKYLDDRLIKKMVKLVTEKIPLIFL